MPSPKPPILRVGIIRTSSIGDVVLATACLDVLRHLKLSSQAVWIGMSPSSQLIRLAYPEIECFDLDGLDNPRSGKFNTIIDRLKDLHLVIDLQLNLRSRLLCRALKRDHGVEIFSSKKNLMARSQMIIGSRFRRRAGPLPYDTIHARTFQFQMMVEGLLVALGGLLPPDIIDNMFGYDPRPSLPLDFSEFKSPWLKELKFGQWLAIAPGAAHGTKQAPTSVFRKILVGLREKYPAVGEENGLGLVFLGSIDERPLALKIFDQIEWPYSVLNLVGKLSLTESTVALSQVRAVLTNDSALSHIAEAVGTSAAVLFGPTVEGFGFAPWREESRAFSVDLGCRPCSKHGKAACRYDDSLCFYNLDTDSIVNYLFERLNKSGA